MRFHEIKYQYPIAGGIHCVTSVTDKWIESVYSPKWKEKVSGKIPESKINIHECTLDFISIHWAEENIKYTR